MRQLYCNVTTTQRLCNNEMSYFLDEYGTDYPQVEVMQIKTMLLPYISNVPTRIIFIKPTERNLM